MWFRLWSHMTGSCPWTYAILMLPLPWNTDSSWWCCWLPSIASSLGLLDGGLAGWQRTKVASCHIRPSRLVVFALWLPNVMPLPHPDTHFLLWILSPSRLSNWSRSSSSVHSVSWLWSYQYLWLPGDHRNLPCQNCHILELLFTIFPMTSVLLPIALYKYKRKKHWCVLSPRVRFTRVWLESGAFFYLNNKHYI